MQAHLRPTDIEDLTEDWLLQPSQEQVAGSQVRSPTTPKLFRQGAKDGFNGEMPLNVSPVAMVMGSKFRGVSKHSKNRWKARLQPRGVCCTFRTEEEAAAAFDKVAKDKLGSNFCNFESLEAGDLAAAKALKVWLQVHPQDGRPKTASGFFGVHPCKGGRFWQASIGHARKTIKPGSDFVVKEAAAGACDDEYTI